MYGHDDGLSPMASPAAPAPLPNLTPPAHGERESIPMPDSFGARLRAAREARGQDLDACASALHLPARVLRQLEADAYEGMDSRVYLVSYLRSYGAYVGVDAAAIEKELERTRHTEVPLVVTGGVSRSRFLLDRYATAATYVVLTAVIVVPMIWLGVHGTLNRDLSNLAPLDSAPVAQQEIATKIATPAAQLHLSTPGVVVPRVNEQPLMASMAPFPNLSYDTAAEPVAKDQAAQSVAGDHRLNLTLSAPSWVEVVGSDGARLEYGLLPAGSSKTYYTDQPVDVLIGNASGANLSLDGNPVTLADSRNSNVARLRVLIDDGKASVATR
jgi:cytoskeleton protein RodZ